MEVPIRLIIVLAIVVLVLVVMSSFFLQSSGSSLTKAEAERVFNTRCVTYSQQACDWSVTYEDDFKSYLEACRILHGQEREAFSCLYTYCSRCYETTDLKCSSLCNICSGHQEADVDRNTCCARYIAECSTSGYDCSRAC